MYISFSKTVAKVGKLRIGAGLRVTKKNAIWMSFLVMFVSVVKLTWYMIIFCGWLIYAIYYGTHWCIKKLVEVGKRKFNNKSCNK